MTTSKGIVIAAVILAFAILASTRFGTMSAAGCGPYNHLEALKQAQPVFAIGGLIIDCEQLHALTFDSFWCRCIASITSNKFGPCSAISSSCLVFLVVAKAVPTDERTQQRGPFLIALGEPSRIFRG